MGGQPKFDEGVLSPCNFLEVQLLASVCSGQPRELGAGNGKETDQEF